MILAREKHAAQGRREGQYAGILARLRTRRCAASQPPRSRATSGTEHYLRRSDRDGLEAQLVEHGLRRLVAGVGSGADATV